MESAVSDLCIGGIETLGMTISVWPRLEPPCQECRSSRTGEAACYAFAGDYGDARVIRRVFKAFQYRDFRLMWFGACTSSIGTWMQIVAQGWLIYRLSHSAFLLALDQFLGGMPIFLFSLIGGVVADRVERRKILLGSQ